MHSARFDALTRSLGDSTRRSLFGVALGGVFAAVTRSGASGQSTPVAAATAATSSTPSAPMSICDSPDTTDLQSRLPGELVASQEITPTDDPTFPPSARAWRVLYVSTGRDNTERTLVCGVVVAPDSAEHIVTQTVDGVSTGQVVAWCHGTLGMVHRCQPSAQPASEIWGPTPYGINTISWGSAANNDQHVGSPENGILAGIIDAGWIVAASDFYVGLGDSDALEPWVVGKIEAANTIDNIRAAYQLLTTVYEGYATRAYDVVTWGHSRAVTRRCGPASSSILTPPRPPRLVTPHWRSPGSPSRRQEATSSLNRPSSLARRPVLVSSIGWPTASSRSRAYRRRFRRRRSSSPTCSGPGPSFPTRPPRILPRCPPTPPLDPSISPPLSDPTRSKPSRG